jgi:VanZ family protein
MKSQLSPAKWIWLCLGMIYMVLFGIILILAYLGQLPGFLTGMDKLGHVVLYGLFTLFGHRLFPQKRIWKLPLFPVLFGIFTTVEEFCQSLSPNRTLDMGDLVCSFVGVLCGYGLAEWLVRRSR